MRKTKTREVIEPYVRVTSWPGVSMISNLILKLPILISSLYSYYTDVVTGCAFSLYEPFTYRLINELFPTFWNPKTAHLNKYLITGSTGTFSSLSTGFGRGLG